jgi:hypothetical protein
MDHLAQETGQVNSIVLSEAENRTDATAPGEVNSTENATVSGAPGPGEKGSSAPCSADDARLIANGYEPIAVIGKRPVELAWQKRPNTPEAIAAERAAYSDATNTGLRTGRLVGVDIDLWPLDGWPLDYTGERDHTNYIKKLAVEVLGVTLVERRGSKGAMLCYRSETPIPKIKVSAEHPTLTQRDPKHPSRSIPLLASVEILGTGQQFVAYGKHPDTGKPYAWTNAAVAYEPLAMPWSALPEVTPGKLREFARRLAERFAELGYKDIKITDAGAHQTAREAVRRKDKIPVPRDYLIEVLRYGAGSPDDRDQWLRTVAAIQTTNLAGVPEQDMDGELLEIAQAYSRGDYEGPAWAGGTPAGWQSDGDVECTYYTLNPDKEGGIGFGSLYHDAQQNGYTKPLPQHERKASATFDEGSIAALAADVGGPLLINTEAADNTKVPGGWVSYAVCEPVDDAAPEIIPGWAEKHIVTYHEGLGGVGKSWISQQEAVCISAGHPVMGEPVGQCDVFYLNYEEPRAEFDRRHTRIQRVFGPLDTTRFRARHLRDHAGAHLLRVTKDGKIILTRFGRTFLAMLGERTAHSYVVFDGLIDAILFEGSSRSDDGIARQVIAMLDRWCVEYDFTGRAILHPSRMGERTDTGSYAPAWNTKPRAIQEYKRVTYDAGGKACKAFSPAAEYTATRRTITKRSHGQDGVSVELVYRSGVWLPMQSAAGGEDPVEVAIDLALRQAERDLHIKADGTIGTESVRIVNRHAIIEGYRRRTDGKHNVAHFMGSLRQAAAEGRITYRKAHGKTLAGFVAPGNSEGEC